MLSPFVHWQTFQVRLNIKCHCYFHSIHEMFLCSFVSLSKSNFRKSSWTHFSQCTDQVEEQQWGNASVLPLPDLHFALHLVGLLGNPATDLLEAHQRMEWSNWKEEWRGMWCRWWCSYSGGAAVVDIWSLFMRSFLSGLKCSIGFVYLVFSVALVFSFWP